MYSFVQGLMSRQLFSGGGGGGAFVLDPKSLYESMMSDTY